MRFKVDEDLPSDVAQIMRDAGYDAASIVEQKMTGEKDGRIWEHVQLEGRCLVTADKGFAILAMRHSTHHQGLILFRLPRESRDGYIALSRRLVTSGKLRDIPGNITVVSPESIRTHRGA